MALSKAAEGEPASRPTQGALTQLMQIMGELHHACARQGTLQ
jgi:hypothetical protein